MLTGDAGRIMDDGTVARLDDETFYVTTTSTGADAVYQWFTWWNAVWFMDVALRPADRSASPRSTSPARRRAS